MGCAGGSGEQQSQRALESGRQKKNMGVPREILETCGMRGMLVFECLEGNFGSWDLIPQCQGNVGFREK